MLCGHVPAKFLAPSILRPSCIGQCELLWLPRLPHLVVRIGNATYSICRCGYK